VVALSLRLLSLVLIARKSLRQLRKLSSLLGKAITRCFENSWQSLSLGSSFTVKFDQQARKIAEVLMEPIAANVLRDANAMSRRLRELVRAPEILIMPGAYDVLSALLFQQLGFQAI